MNTKLDAKAIKKSPIQFELDMKKDVLLGDNILEGNCYVEQIYFDLDRVNLEAHIYDMLPQK